MAVFNSYVKLQKGTFAGEDREKDFYSLTDGQTNGDTDKTEIKKEIKILWMEEILTH